MSEYEQMEMDLRTDNQRIFMQRVSEAIELRKEQLDEEMASITNRHQGYGLAAQSWAAVGAAIKTCGNDMKDFLKILPSDDGRAVDVSTALADDLSKLAITVISAAASASRISAELYSQYSMTQPEKTPVEEYLEANGEDEEDETETEDAAEESEEHGWQRTFEEARAKAKAERSSRTKDEQINDEEA